MRSITLRGIGVDTKPGRLVAVFTLSEAPDPAWTAFFRKRARYSVFDVAAATFRRNWLRVDLASREDLAELTRSVERLIEGANIDIEFRMPEDEGEV